MSLEAYSWPEATVTVIPSDNRAPFVLGYAQGLQAQRTYYRDILGRVFRAKDQLSVDALWVEDETYAWLQAPSVAEWIVEYQNSDGRTFTERWEAVKVNGITKAGSLENNVVRLSIEAEGEPVLE
ncbi:MAG: hypothetical protein ACM3UP_00585 [Methanocella sp.]